MCAFALLGRCHLILFTFLLLSIHFACLPFTLELGRRRNERSRRIERDPRPNNAFAFSLSLLCAYHIIAIALRFATPHFFLHTPAHTLFCPPIPHLLPPLTNNYFKILFILSHYQFKICILINIILDMAFENKTSPIKYYLKINKINWDLKHIFKSL